MPWFRQKLLRGTNVIHIQKRWLFGARFYEDYRNPINKKKAECVKLEKKITLLKAEIANAEREYLLEVTFMTTKIKRHDKDGGALTSWKEEKLKWWQFSIFQWAKPFIEEPMAFDPRTYRTGSARGQAKERPKDMQIADENYAIRMKKLEGELTKQ
jgi:hypothetical protein